MAYRRSSSRKRSSNRRRRVSNRDYAPRRRAPARRAPARRVSGRRASGRNERTMKLVIQLAGVNSIASPSNHGVPMATAGDEPKKRKF